MSFRKRLFKGCFSKKKLRMSSLHDIDETSNNLILDVPQELLQVYSKFLDLKSNVMFNAVCRKTRDKKVLKQSELNTIFIMFGKIANMIQELHNIFGTTEGQNKLLANILRRLIYVSVSDIPSETEGSFPTSKTLMEYKNIMLTTMEKMDISMSAFNNLLEDAQFEFRGFRIIDLQEESRMMLNSIKSILSEIYFSQKFTIHTYTTFGNMFLEFMCDDENLMLDIHERLDDDIWSWSFLTDILKQFMIDNPTNPLVKELRKHNVIVSDSMITWKKNNHEVLYILTQLIYSLIDCSKIYMGSDSDLVDIWNETSDNNWLLKTVIDEVRECGMYTQVLEDITNSVQNGYETASLC